MDPTKERNLRERQNGRNGLRVKGETFAWGTPSPSPGIYRVDANPSEISLPLGLSTALAPAWSWPRSRRSACFPAEAYHSAPVACSVSAAVARLEAIVEQKKA